LYIGDELEIAKVKALSRTYAPAIAGIPISMKFDSSTGYFYLVFKINTTIQAPTEIFLNEKFYYPNGFSVTISPDVATYTAVSTNYINITPKTNAKNGQQVIVTISAK